MEQQKTKHGWLTWLLLIFIPIVGIIVMWVKRKDYSTRKKTILTVIFSLWFIFLLLGSSSDSTDIDTMDNVAVEETQSEISNTETTENNENAGNNENADSSESKKQEAVSEYPDNVNGINTGEVEEIKEEEPEPTAEETAQNNTSSSDSSDYFNTYDNAEQQQTADTYVLNTNTLKIHRPSCSSVKKIAPENYSTTNSSIDELISQGYSTCGICLK